MITRTLSDLGACREAREWVGALPAGTTPEQAWAACERGDWLLWIAARIGVDRRVVALAACACARTVLPLWDARYPDDRRPLAAIEAAEGWARGEVGIDVVRGAAAAAAAAVGAADAAYAAYAAAYGAASDAAYAAYAAAAYAAAYGAASDARAVSPRAAADIVREHVAWTSVAAALAAREVAA